MNDDDPNATFRRDGPGSIRAMLAAGEKIAPAKAKPNGAAVEVAVPIGAKILDGVYDFLGRFVCYPSNEAHIAHTLWIGHTHCMDAWESTPRLAFLSQEPESGKTRALEITELLVPRPVLAINVSPAYLFRKVADPAGRPTILFDEIDAIFGPKAKEHEDIRALLNAGHRKGAKAGRCVVRGNVVQTEEIEAYSGVAIAGLGALPDTILSRSIVIRMRRRAPDEIVEPYRKRVHGGLGEKWRDLLVDWLEDAQRDLRWPDMPDGITDRAADAWEPLLAIADLAGGEWPEKARAAAKALVAASKATSPSLGLRLLADIRTAFVWRDEEPAEQQLLDGLPTKVLLERLIAPEEAPWGDLRGKPLDNRRLAAMLKLYEIKPDTIRFDEQLQAKGFPSQAKGYRRADFEDAWARYLPSSSPPPETSVPAVPAVTTTATREEN